MSEMKLIMENFRAYGRLVEEEESTLPRYMDDDGNQWLDKGRILTLCSERSCRMMRKTPEVMAGLTCITNCPEQTASPEQTTSSIKENMPALKQPIDIGKAAATVGGLQLEDGYMFYTIDGERPSSPANIEKLAQPGTVLRHHFKPDTDLNRMIDLVNLAQQGKAIKSAISQRANPTRAFFEAGLVFRMSPDLENNAVKLVVSAAPHLKRNAAPSVAPGLPPQR